MTKSSPYLRRSSRHVRLAAVDDRGELGAGDERGRRVDPEVDRHLLITHESHGDVGDFGGRRDAAEVVAIAAAVVLDADEFDVGELVPAAAASRPSGSKNFDGSMS